MVKVSVSRTVFHISGRSLECQHSGTNSKISAAFQYHDKLCVCTCVCVVVCVFCLINYK